MTYNFRHNNPADRLSPANARLSIMHSFEFALQDQSEADLLFSFLEGQRDIWLYQGLNPNGSIGSMPTSAGRLPLFRVETPRNDLAMLFKLTFGGVR